jgi:hypothetical protein
VLFSQEYEKAIVTDLNYFRRINGNVTEENFPFYFMHKEFILDVQHEIALQLKAKYNLNDVYFLSEDSIYYAEGSVVPSTEAKDYARYTHRDKTIYVSVETILQSHMVLNDEQVYRFTTRVEVFNYKGRRIYKFKNHIPFVSVFSDEIAGRAFMGEQDFYTFYFDGIFLAFEGKYPNVTKRYVNKPTAEKYLSFVNSAEKFYLNLGATGYNFGKDLSNLSEILHFPLNYWTTDDGVFDIINLVTTDFLENGYTLLNRLDKKEYNVRLKGGVNSLRNKYSLKDPVDFTIETSTGGLLGHFRQSHEGNLLGAYQNQNVEFKWVDNYSCLEVYFNGSLLALVNYFGDQKVLFLTKAIDRKQLLALTNLLFVYDYAEAIRYYMLLKF